MNALDTLVQESNEQLNAIVNIAETIATALPHTEVEICGSWVWISNTQREDAKALKALGLGLKWSPNKSKWYYAGSKAKSFGKSVDMDKIRAWHGSERIVK